MADPGVLENPLSLTGEKNMMWLPHTPPASWIVDELKKDDHIRTVELFTDRPDAADLIAGIEPDISGLQDADRPLAYELGNNLRSFIFKPVITDTFGPEEHISGRRLWLRTLHTRINEQRGSTDARRMFDFVSSNKLSRGEIGKASTSLEYLAELFPGLIPADVLESVQTMHENSFKEYRTDVKGERFTKYDEMPLDGKRNVVSSFESLVVSALQSLNGVKTA